MLGRTQRLEKAGVIGTLREGAIEAENDLADE
jgi:hypothetical protein